MPGPTLSTPSNAAQNEPLTLSFSWSSVGGATAYEVQIARDTAFSDLAYDTTVFTTALVLYDRVPLDGYPLDFGQTYFWRVRAITGSTLGDRSSAFSFSTEAGALAYIPLTDHESAIQGMILEQFKG